MRFETTERSGWTNEAKEALQRIKRKLNKLQTLVVPKEGEIMMLCLRQKDETISSVLLVEREGIQIHVFYVSRPLQGMEISYTPTEKMAKSTPTPRAWRLYLGKETIKEGSGVGIILVSPEKRMHSYAIHLKFNTSDHVIDCEALLAGLAASVSKGMKDLHVFIDSPKLVAQTEGNHTPATKQERKYKKNYRCNSPIPQEVSVGIKTRPSVEKTSSNKKGKAASNIPGANPNYNWEASGSN
ncbi:reverse transcriptase domain-containing protein [Tanacetum coccineum]